MRYFKRLSSVAVICFWALACGDSTGPGEAGFTATVSGDMQLELSGEAIFGVSTEGGVDRWMIFLNEGAFLGLDYDMIGFIREGSVTPIGVGTHTLVDAAGDALDDEDIGGVYWFGRHTGSLGVFTSDEGNLTITSASADWIEGTFSFSGTLDLGYGPDIVDVTDVTVTGNFSAEPGTIPSGAVAN